MGFIKGMDVSMASELEARHAVYRLDGAEDDLFRILKKCGTDMIRLRLWQDPFDESGATYGGGMNDLIKTIGLAKRTVEAGMSFLLDFHYSDFWADPKKQIKPKTWERLSGRDLETAVYLHTAESLKALKNKGLVPDMIQIGNEITNGLLWPDGAVENPDGLAALLKSGIAAARKLCPEARVVLHLDFGTDNALYREWFDRIAPYGLDFDIIGMSYYPHWNGSIDALTQNMNDISERYAKDVLVAETSIGYTTGTLGCEGVVYTEKEEADTGYPATPEGQRDFLHNLFDAVRGVRGGRGIGVFYWEPAWLPIPECTWGTDVGCAYMRDEVKAGNAMANQALFDKNGNANIALTQLKEL